MIWRYYSHIGSAEQTKHACFMDAENAAVCRGKSLKRTAQALNAIILKCICHKIDLFALFDAHTSIHHYVFSKRQNCCRIKCYCIK